MSSRETIRLMRLMTSVRYRIGCLPYYAVCKTEVHLRLVAGSRSHKHFWVATILLNLGFKTVFIFGLGLWYEFTKPISMEERVQFYFLASLFAFAFSCHLLALCYSDRIRELGNQSESFDAHLRKSVFLSISWSFRSEIRISKTIKDPELCPCFTYSGPHCV